MKKSAGKPTRKPLKWVGSSLEDLSGFPLEVKKAMGHALHLAQIGMKAPQAKVMSGFLGTSVVEVVEDYDGDTFRGVYTVKFQGVVYVLHAFQKKSKSGIATPKHEINPIKDRLKAAEADFKARGSKGS